MTVKIVDKKTGQETAGKYAVVKGGEVGLFSGIMSDKKGAGAAAARKPFLRRRPSR